MIKKLMMMFVATMAATLFPQVLKAEMQIGLTSNYAYSEGSVKIDGRDWYYVEMEDYVSHIGYDVVPWVFEYGDDQHDNICIPVTGCGREKIVPIITLGTAMSADRLKATVLTDAEFASKFHIGEYNFEIDDEDDEYYYESISKRLEIEFPRSVWPEGKIIDNRQWILVSLANVRIGQDGFFSPKTFTVGIKGTNLITPIITIRPDDDLPKTTRFTPPNVFGLGLSMYSLGDMSFDPFFGLWDGVGVGDGAGRVPYCFDTGEHDGRFGSLTFQVSSSGELYIKIETRYHGPSWWDFPADKLQISGAAYGGTFRTIGSPNNYWTDEPFWIVLDVKKAGSLTIGNYGEEFIANGIWFRPSSVSESECLATEAWYREEITVADDMRMANFRGFVTGMGVVPFGQKAKLVCYPNEGEELDHWEFINCEKPEDATVYSQTLNFTITKALYDQIEAEDESIKRVIVRPVFRTLPDYEPRSDTPVISAIVADGCEAMGKVTGGKTAKAGTKVTLKATANKGYVFSHWEGPLGDGIDPRNPSISYVVGESDVEFVAYFSPISDSSDIILQESYGPFVPGTEVELNLGLVGYTAKKLPSGLKLDKKTGIVRGKAKKPGEYQATFTKKGAETLTAKFIVGPMPTITIMMEGDTEKCKVTGASKPGNGYLVGKKVSLSAKGPKGTAFTGWFKDGAPWPNETEYLESKLKYVMTEENLSLVARFEKEKMSVACDGLSSLTVGEEVLIPIAIETQSGVKSVKGSKLPTGLKVMTDKVTGEWFVTGKPKKVGTWNSVIEVTVKSGAVEQLPVTVTVAEAYTPEGNLTAANGYFRESLKMEKMRSIRFRSASQM